MNRLTVPQPVRLLCPDDVVRDPSTRRLVRIVEHVEDNGRYAFFSAVDVETQERLGLRLHKSTRLVVYTD